MLHGHLWGLGLWSGWRWVDCGHQAELTAGLFGVAEGGSSTVYRVVVSIVPAQERQHGLANH